MATVTRENIGLLNDKLIVNLSKEDYLPAFEKNLKQYAKTANIPGFRKGMVPTSLVKKMYGTSVFSDEVLKTVEKQLNEYVATEKLEIIAQPLPLDNDSRMLDMNNPADYAFAFEIGLKPEINVDVANIPVTRYKIQVTDEMINEEVARLQTRQGKQNDAETVTSEDDVLNVELIEADENGNEIEGGIKKDNSLLVKYFTPDVQAQLQGKKAEDRITVKLSQAFDKKERDFVAGDLGLDTNSDVNADKTFIVAIKKISLLEKSELNEEFFKQVYPGREDIATEEAFRQAVKEEIEKAYDAQSRNQVQDQIYHALVDHTQYDFPETFLKRWLKVSDEKATKTEEEIEAEYPKFVSQLKWSLITTKLIENNGITVEPDDIKAFAKERIMSYMGGQNFNDVSWLDDYAERMMKDKKFVEQSYYEIQTMKLFGALDTQVNATEEPISVEAFTEKLHHHHH